MKYLKFFHLIRPGSECLLSYVVRKLARLSSTVKEQIPLYFLDWLIPVCRIYYSLIIAL